MKRHSGDGLKPRLVDVQGRVVVPKDVLEKLDIRKGEGYVAFVFEGDEVVLKRVNWTVK